MSHLSPIEFFIGVQRARYLALASFSLLLYEYMLTLDDEIRYFWTGPWSLSRILYFINRYVPPVVMVMTLLTFFGLDLSSTTCKRNIQAAIILSFLAVSVIQAILSLRTYYLFSPNLPVRIFVIAIYLAATTSSFVITTMVSASLEARPSTLQSISPTVGCLMRKSRPLWPLFIPALIFHTIIYILTSVRAMTVRSTAPVLKRLRRDGGLFFVVVVISVGLSGIGAFLTDSPIVNVPAIYSNFMLCITSISVSRVMLSIHSLAANLGTDPEWLLNNVELSRVRWTKGAHDGELIVEIDVVDGEEWEVGLDSRSHNRNELSVSSSRMGMIEGYYAGSSPYPYY